MTLNSFLKGSCNWLHFIKQCQLLYNGLTEVYNVKSDLVRPWMPGRVSQSVARLIQEPEVPGSIPGPAIYFRFCFH